MGRSIQVRALKVPKQPIGYFAPQVIEEPLGVKRESFPACMNRLDDLKNREKIRYSRTESGVTTARIENLRCLPQVRAPAGLGPTTSPLRVPLSGPDPLKKLFRERETGALGGTGPEERDLESALWRLSGTTPGTCSWHAAMLIGIDVEARPSDYEFGRSPSSSAAAERSAIRASSPFIASAAATPIIEVSVR